MYVMQKDSLSFVNVDWNTVKRGLGQDLALVPNSGNFFIGLENLRQLTSQAGYRVLVWMTGSPKNAAAFYYNFTLGAESSNYALSYDR